MKVPILGWTIDERFLMHRQRSTSIGGMAGVAVAGAFFFYDLFARHVQRWDLFAVIAAAALVKLAVLTWYRITD
jgi:hypothetical protein